MVATLLVDKDIEAGRSVVERLDRAGFPLSGAFWLYNSETDLWTLYLVTPLVDQEVSEIDESDAILGEDSPVKLVDISLISPNNPKVHQLAKTHKTGPGIHGIRLYHNFAGDEYIERGYIYRMNLED